MLQHETLHNEPTAGEREAGGPIVGVRYAAQDPQSQPVPGPAGLVNAGLQLDETPPPPDMFNSAVPPPARRSIDFSYVMSYAIHVATITIYCEYHFTLTSTTVADIGIS